MACSDNVVRAGLTPKYKDVDTLCSMLTYQTGPASDKLFSPIVEDCHCSVYSPPVQDFAVARICLTEGQYETKARKSASIILVIEGEGEGMDCAAGGPQKLSKGKCYFVASGSEVKITHKSGNLVMFQAFANIKSLV